MRWLPTAKITIITSFCLVAIIILDRIKIHNALAHIAWQLNTCFTIA